VLNMRISLLKTYFLFQNYFVFLD